MLSSWWRWPSARVHISAALSSGTPEEIAQAWQNKLHKLASSAEKFRIF
jgi:hypothetical protein